MTRQLRLTKMIYGISDGELLLVYPLHDRIPPIIIRKATKETQGLNDLSFQPLDHEGESSRGAGGILPEVRIGSFRIAECSSNSP